MKKAGLIGGMSWESTVPYYKIINEVIGQQLGGLYSADCILHSINFYEIESTISKGNWDKSNELLANAAESLENAGADFIGICSNTMHKCLPAIKKKVNLPIVHIVDATVEEMKREGMSEAEDTPAEKISRRMCWERMCSIWARDHEVFLPEF